MLNFIYCGVIQCVPVYPFLSHHPDQNSRLRGTTLKPRLHRAFAEGLEGYDVSRRFETLIVFRPSLAEIEAGWKPKNAAHEDDDEEEDDELPQWYSNSRRVRIPDV